MISRSITVILFIFICVTVAQDDPPVKETIIDEVFQDLDAPPVKEPLPPIIDEELDGPITVFVDGLRSVGVVARKISAIAASVEVLMLVIARNFVDLSSTLFNGSQIFNLIQLALYFAFPI